MKAIVFIICAIISLPGLAQKTQDSLKKDQKMILNSPKAKTTSANDEKIKVSSDSTKQKAAYSVSELFSIGEKTYKKSVENAPFSGHWRGFHVGFMNFAKLPDAFDGMSLDPSGSFSLQFNFANHAINLSRRQNFGIVTGLGLEYQRFRFNDENNTLTKKDGHTGLIPVKSLYSDVNEIERSTFKNLYLTIPLLLEVQFPAAKRPAGRLYVSAGVMGGVRMHSKTKVIYNDSENDRQKQKQKGNFNVVPFKADAVARIGYSKISVWGSYTLTNLFKEKDMPDLNVYTIGFGFTF